MSPAIDPACEDAVQMDLLATPVGVPGSGRTRYAAAMYLHQRGLVSADLLEAYRICCKLDAEDPIATAERLGVR